MSERVAVLADSADGSFPEGYAKDRYCCWRDRGTWLLNVPGAGLATLARHEVEEHEDGSISARPSIAIGGPKRGQWLAHGFLTRGVWRDV